MTMYKRLNNVGSAMTGMKAAARFCMFLLIFLLAFGTLSGSVFAAAGDTPAHSKSLDDNDDGSYKLELTVTGDADDDVEVQGSVNVLIVYDHSVSMEDQVSGTNTSRADQAEAVVYDFVHRLFSYQKTGTTNIEVALVTFARTASGNDHPSQEWTSTESQITRFFDSNPRP